MYLHQTESERSRQIQQFGSQSILSVAHSLNLKAQWLLYVPPGLTLQKSYVLPTQCIYAFCVDLRTNSDYFPIQH
jgi:hypothetical protein